jgi:hypothetical protein
MIAAAAPAAEAPVEPILELVQEARAASVAGDEAAWMELARAAHERAPEHPNLLIGYARALAAAGRAGEALPYLEQAVERGAGFELASYPEFAEASTGGAYQALAGRARANLAPVAPPEAWLVIENTNVQPEGIAWDGETSKLYISSFNREIWSVTPDRGLTRFAGAEAGLQQVAGLKVDRKRRLLWAASAGATACSTSARFRTASTTSRSRKTATCTFPTAWSTRSTGCGPAVADSSASSRTRAWAFRTASHCPRTSRGFMWRTSKA